MSVAKFPPEYRPVIDLIASYKAGMLDPQRDAGLIREAVEVVRHHHDHPGMCSSVKPTELEPGQAVAFRYDRPDVNEPWRFGVVGEFRAGCWTIYTFNITRRREKTKTDKPKIVADGPGFRSYSLEAMAKVRHVLAPAAHSVDPAAAEDLAQLGVGVRELMKRIFGE